MKNPTRGKTAETWDFEGISSIFVFFVFFILKRFCQTNFLELFFGPQSSVKALLRPSPKDFWGLARCSACLDSGSQKQGALPELENPSVSGTARQVCLNFCNSQATPMKVPAKRIPFVLSLLFREMVPNTHGRLKNVRDYTEGICSSHH